MTLSDKYNSVWSAKISSPYKPPEANNRIHTTLSILKPSNLILDVGCGDGCFLELAKQKYTSLYGKDKYTSLYGLDVSSKAVQTCIKKGILAQVYKDKFPFRNSYFDTVTCLDVIGHVDDPRDTISEMARVLKSGGTLILSTPNMRYIKHLYTLFIQGKFPALSTSSIDTDIMYDGGILHYFTFKNLKEILEKNDMKVTKKLGVFGRNHIVEFLSPGLVIEAVKV